ncbi:MAG: hypothetical protein FGM46_06555 [Ferruginibacter sp.]|nr:hypothetical protein [Ferruginibacter sp.]
MKNILLFFVFVICAYETRAQQYVNIEGSVQSPDGLLLSNATVILIINKNDSLKKIADNKGIFRFKNIVSQDMVLKLSYAGFEDTVTKINLSGKTGDILLGAFTLRPSAKMLENVLVESQKIQIKEDTVSYTIDSTMYRKNDNVEDVLKKLPGIQVGKDGTVTAQGKQVTKVKVNGKDFFGGDVTTATRELNADMVDKIQLIDDYGDQSAFTGIKEGDPSKTLNIQLRKDKNKGYFGSLTAGGGTEDRYIGSFSINKFNNTQQISLIGNINNTNANLFNFGSGVGPFANMANSMARSMGIGRGGGGFASTLGNFGNSDGITQNKSIGVNYRDEWGSKISVYGSYSFSNKNNQTLNRTTQQNIFENNTTFFVQQSDNQTVTDNHRVSMNVEYRIDSMNYLKINPVLNYSSNNTNNQSIFTNQFLAGVTNSEGNMNDRTQYHNPNFSGSLLFNHRFRKKGRYVSLNVNSGVNSSNADDAFVNTTLYYIPNSLPTEKKLIQQITQDNGNDNFGIKASYNEPLSKKQNIELNYTYIYQFIENDRKTYNTDPGNNIKTLVDSSTNVYSNNYQLNRFGINFRTTEKKYNYSVGFSIQPATIATNSISGGVIFTNHLINYYPVVRFAYNFSKSRALNINYNGSTNQPSNTQLQPIVDKSNPQFITIGNPDLRPEFTSNFSMRYSNFNFVNGNVFFGNISASFTQDKIVNNVKLLKAGVQETRYLNANGFFTILGYYNISRPIANRKYVFNFGGNVTFNNNVSFITDNQNAVQRNIGKNWLIGQRISTDITIKKWLETNISLNYSLNSSRYTLQKQLNLTTHTWTMSGFAKVFFPHDFIFSFEIDKTMNQGFSGNVISNPLIINSTLEKVFLKKKNLSFKLQSYDLLNQNIGISRNVSSVGFTDIRANRLARYFLLTLVYRLNQFYNNQQGMRMMAPGSGEMPSMRGPVF